MAQSQVFLYGIVGSGKLATHFAHYLNLKKLSYRSWSRRTHGESSIKQALSGASHVLWLIRDEALPEVFKQNAWEGPVHIQCSGLVHIDGVFGAHPLMSFSDQLYDLELYRKIPFALEKQNGAGFAHIFPGLENPHFEIDAAQKPLYHALCVLSGNFTHYLWRKAFGDFRDKLHIPETVLYPYLSQVFKNLQIPDLAPTGPITRSDRRVIDKHLEALAGDNYQKVYQAFVDIHFTPSKEAQI